MGDDAFIQALSALGWILGEGSAASFTGASRAERLLAMTGLTPDQLRERAGDPQLLSAVIAFLAQHEPDLLACAEAIGVPPARLVAAGEALGS